MVFEDIKKVITNSIHRYCNQIGYRFGKQLGFGDYGSVYQSYWLDNQFEGLSLAVKVIKVAQNVQIFQSKTNKSKTEKLILKRVNVKVGFNYEIVIEITSDGKIILNAKSLIHIIKSFYRVNNQNVINVKDILLFNKNKSEKYINPTQILILMELSPMSLKNNFDDFWDKDKRNLTEREIISWSTQIARGNNYFINAIN
jgi:serine/threonine protein kinase